MTDHQLIHDLRFPEFTENSPWRERKLSEVLSEHGLKSEGSEEVFSVSVHKGVVNQIDHLGRRFAASSTEHYKRVLPGDIIYTKSPTGDFPFGIIKQSKVPVPVIVSPLYGVFTPETIWLGVILDAYFEEPSRTINHLASIVQKGAKNTINIKNDIFLSKSLALPHDKYEQEKIAACLSSLDELLAAHRDKLQALKEHKKGLMQILFPQEGETVPKVRFPEFEQDGEWNSETVAGIYDFKVTNSLSRENLNYEKGEVRNIHYGDVHTKFKTLFDINKEQVPFINADVPTNKIKKEQYCVEGDMIFADASEDLNDIGKSIEVVNLNSEKLVSGLHTLLARQKEDKLIIGFGGYLFKADSVRRQIQREAQGAKVLGISVGRISNIKIPYPKNKAEQQRIAACLSSLDALVTTQAEKIEQLRQHKKGLMQGLFPKIVE